MAQDKNLPAFLLGRNRMFGTNHTIIFGFLAVCWALFYLSRGDVLVLGSIYAIAFLCVMGLFAVGSIALQESRRQPWRVRQVATVSCALGAVVLAVLVNCNIFLLKLESRYSHINPA